MSVDNLNSTGVYLIINKINGHSYIGSTVNSFKERWAVHRWQLNTNQHHSPYLQRAWNKYGQENFDFTVITECAPKDCLRLEQWHLNAFSPCYNSCKIAGSRAGSKHSEETKRKIGLKAAGRNNPMCGRKGKLHPFSKKVRVINKIDNTIKIFDSGKDAADFLNINGGIFNKIVNNKYPKPKKFDHLNFLWEPMDEIQRKKDTGLAKSPIKKRGIYKIRIENKNTGEIQNFCTIKEASKSLDIFPTNLCEMMQGHKLQYKKFAHLEFSYLDRDGTKKNTAKFERKPRLILNNKRDTSLNQSFTRIGQAAKFLWITHGYLSRMLYGREPKSKKFEDWEFINVSAV